MENETPEQRKAAMEWLEDFFCGLSSLALGITEEERVTALAGRPQYHKNQDLLNVHS